MPKTLNVNDRELGQIVTELLGEHTPDRYYPEDKGSMSWIQPVVKKVMGLMRPLTLEELEYERADSFVSRCEAQRSRKANNFLNELSKRPLLHLDDYRVNKRVYTLAFEIEEKTQKKITVETFFGQIEEITKPVIKRRIVRVPLASATEADHQAYEKSRAEESRKQRQACRNAVRGSQILRFNMHGYGNNDEWLRPFIERGDETLYLKEPTGLLPPNDDIDFSIDPDAEAACRARSEGICECTGECGEHYGCRCQNPHEQTHHLTYARQGHEDLDDLLGVCLKCHPGCDKNRDGRRNRK